MRRCAGIGNRSYMSDGVPTRFVNTLLRMVGDRGYDFSGILATAGLDFDPTDENAAGYRSGQRHAVFPGVPAGSAPAAG